MRRDVGEIVEFLVAGWRSLRYALSFSAPRRMTRMELAANTMMSASPMRLKPRSQRLTDSEFDVRSARRRCSPSINFAISMRISVIRSSPAPRTNTRAAAALPASYKRIVSANSTNLRSTSGSISPKAFCCALSSISSFALVIFCAIALAAISYCSR